MLSRARWVSVCGVFARACAGKSAEVAGCARSEPLRALRTGIRGDSEPDEGPVSEHQRKPADDCLVSVGIFVCVLCGEQTQHNSAKRDPISESAEEPSGSIQASVSEDILKAASPIVGVGSWDPARR